MPKLHDKEIVRLDPNEVAILLDQVEDGTKMTKSQMKFHDKTKVRDLALLTLLLGTGIRVSECVGLEISDVDLISQSRCDARVDTRTSSILGKRWRKRFSPTWINANI